MLKAIGDNIVIQKESGPATTASGFYIPNQNKAVECTGVVTAVGEGVKGIKVGNEIVFRPYAAAELKVDKVEYLVLEQEDVIGVLEK